MELTQLRYFCAVVQHGSITAAAEALYVSQPALSKTIIHLERELGHPLFDRIGRRIHLNPRGRAFYERVKDALDLIDNAQSELIDLEETITGEVNLLVLAASSWMADLIVRFKRRYPAIRIHMHQQTRYDLRHSEQYDFCISATPMNYASLAVLPLLTEEIVLVASARHPLAGRESIDLAEAAEYDFVAYSRGPSLRELMDSLCYMAGFTPRIVLEGDSVETLLASIGAEIGVSLLPLRTFRNPADTGLAVVHLHQPAAQRTVNLTWSPDKYMPKACRLFRDFCQSYFEHRENDTVPHS